jgi:hypothetical protein
MAFQPFRKAALDRLSSTEHLDQLVQVTRPQGWTALVILTAILIAALVWGYFGSITREVSGTGIMHPRSVASASDSSSQTQAFETVLFMPPEAASVIKTGMEAHIFPSYPHEGKKTFLPGTVGSVEGELTEQGPRIKVEVMVQPDHLASGLNWAAWFGSNGTPASLPVTGRIIVQRTRPLNLLLPSRNGEAR